MSHHDLTKENSIGLEEFKIMLLGQEEPESPPKQASPEKFD